MSDYDETLDDFDPGIGMAGPWLGWHAKDNHSRTILAGTWSLREGGGVDEPFELKQMVVDWPSSRTGWKEDTGGVKGVSPRKQWNASRKKFEKEPADGAWKKAMQLQIAWAPDQRALWEQSGFGAYVSFVDIMRLIMATAPGELPKLPLLAWTGKREIRTGGGPTLVAVFGLVRYVQPPACLLEMRALMAPASAPAITAPVAKPAVDGWTDAPTSRREQITQETQRHEPNDHPIGGDLEDEIPF